MGCSGLEESEKEKMRQMNATGEYIYRSSDEFLYPIVSPKKRVRERYSWEDTYVGNQVKITKEFFRCLGSGQNPRVMKKVHGTEVYAQDCGGMHQHSLPLKNGKPYIYPALLEILNFIQEKTRKQVVITCGYRCPTHNTYADSSEGNQTSKHMIGAEVDFYVKGLEWSPEEIVELIKKYYKWHPQFKDKPIFTNFSPYEKETDVSTIPWYNKEIFIKLFKKDEGRDFDNNHKFPYICIQLKWDREEDKPVSYSWKQAFNGYLRY